MIPYNKIRRQIFFLRGLAHVVSALFHPLLMPTYIFILITQFAPLSVSPLNSEGGKKFLLWLIFLSTFLLPFLLLGMYIMIGNTKWEMKKFFMENSKDRVFPFLVIGTFYSLIIYFLRKAPQINDTIVVIMMSITVAILLCALISSFWKISAHSTGISGMITILAVINNMVPDSSLFYPITLLILLSGFLMSARLYLDAHTPEQIWAGCFLGFTLGGMTYFFI